MLPFVAKLFYCVISFLITCALSLFVYKYYLLLLLLVDIDRNKYLFEFLKNHTTFLKISISFVSF